jgi:hypothetical protein
MSVHQFYPAGDAPMTISWQVRLDAARTEAEVVDAVRDFMATISPYDIARLPERCRPRKIVDASDITHYAFVIVRHHCDQGESSSRVAHKLASFFTSASIRLSHILSAPLGNMGACDSHPPSP